MKKKKKTSQMANVLCFFMASKVVLENEHRSGSLIKADLESPSLVVCS